MSIQLAHFRGLLDPTDGVTRPLIHFFPEHIQEQLDLTRYKLTDQKRVARFMLGVARVLSCHQQLHHRYIRFTGEPTSFHQGAAFPHFVGNIMLALDRGLIVRELGRDALSANLRAKFFTLYYKGNNLLKHGCSAYILSPWLYEAFKAWLFQHEDAQVFADQVGSLDVELGVVGEVNDQLTIGPAERRNITDLLRTQYAARDIIGTSAALTLQQATSGGTLAQAYNISRTGRYQGLGVLSLQTMRKVYRHQVLRGWHDYDVSACAQTIMVQLYESETGEQLPGMREYLNNKVEVRAELATAFSCDVKDAKALLTSALFKRSPTLAQIESDTGVKLFVTKLAGSPSAACEVVKSCEILRLIWRDCDAIIRHFSRQDFNNSITNVAGQKRRLERYSSGRSLAHKYFGYERQVLDVIRRYCQLEGTQLVMIHDGFITNRKINIARVRALVKEETGFVLDFEHNRL